MIEYKVGDLLDVKQGNIVHGCNNRGGFGSGVAGAIRMKWPHIAVAYLDWYDSDILMHPKLALGLVRKENVSFGLHVWNAITQDGYGRDPRTRYARYDAIETAFRTINDNLQSVEPQFRPIHIPKIGAGLGNGNWKIIETIINETVTTIPVTCWVLDPKEIP